MASRRSDAHWLNRDFAGVPGWGLVASAMVVVAVGGFAWWKTSQPEPTASWTPVAQESSTPEPSPSESPAPVAVFVGDSYTAGAGSTDPMLRFSTRVATAEGWDEVNLGVGGVGYVVIGTQDPTVAQAACGLDYCPSYSEVIDQVVEAQPDIVVVSGGRNNTGSDIATIRTSVEDFYSQIREAVPDAVIYVTSPVWDDDPAPEVMGEIASAVEGSAKGVGAIYLDIGEPLLGHPELVVADGIHPTDDGHAALAEAVIAALGEL